MYYTTVPSAVVQFKRRILMLQLDLLSRVPIHEQIVNGILRLRTVGVMKSGDKLPSVRSLAQSLGVNPNTVQKAYSTLEATGVIYSLPGKGSFLAQNDAAQEAVLENQLQRFRQEAQKAKRIGISEKELIAIVDEIYQSV